MTMMIWCLLQGVFDYRIRIQIHTESHFRFTCQIEWL